MKTTHTFTSMLRAAIVTLCVVALTSATFPATGQPDNQGPVEFIVSFRELPDEAKKGQTFHGAQVIHDSPSLEYAVVRANNPHQFQNGAENDNRVRYVVERTRNDPLLQEEDGSRPVQYPPADPSLHSPTDPQFASQYGPQQIRADEAWDTTLGQTTKNVCVVDTGVRYTHEDIAGSRWLGGTDTVNDDSDPMDDHGHGTHVTGTAAGSTNNGLGIAGIGQVGILGVKGIGVTSTTADMLADGVDWCTNNGADIISMSWRWLAAWGGQDLIRTALENAAAQGLLLIAAAGNGGCTNCIEFPASMDEVMAVTCTTASESLCSFSSTGPEAELAAPGNSVLSSCFGSDTAYCSMSGTSMSTPHVSGAAGLIWSYAPSLSAADIRQILTSTAQDLGTSGFDNNFGHGEVDVAAGLEAAIQSPLDQDFESGTTGWSFTGFWHVTNKRSNTPTQSLWYGQESTGNYDNGVANSGTATTPSVTVPSTDPKLAVKSWYETEAGTSFDQKFVEISTNGGSTWTNLLQVTNTQQQWTTLLLDLSAYADQSVILRFRFDTVDSIANAFEGWYVDDVRVTGTQLPASGSFNEDFDDGSANGWTLTGFWHVTTKRSFTSPNSLWYGQESTGNYDNGASNSGTATTPSISVPSTSPKLTFRSWYETESGTTFDQKLVEVSTNGGSTWTTLVQISDTQLQWNAQSIDLSSYAGQSVLLRFRFDTIDSVANAFEGWYVDDVAVTGQGSLDENFDDGSANGWTLTGFWHVTTKRSFTSPNSLWYGQESTGNYDNGASNSGTATTPAVTVPTSNPKLTFQSWYETESGTTFDQKLVEVSTNGGSTWTTLVQISDTQLQWNAQSIDLSSYAGQSVLLRFRFDTIDSVANAFEGWYVDDVKVQSVANLAPTACFSVSPSTGTTSTFFLVDASCSTDDGGTSSLQVRWDWENDGVWDTSYTTTKTASHSYSSSGTKTIRVEAKDAFGATDTATQSVLVNNPPTACFTVTPSTGTTSTFFSVNAACSSDDLTSPSSLQVRWDWENDGVWDTSYTTTKTASHSYSSSGTKTIRLEVKDGHGSTATTTNSVLVNNPPSACFTATPADGMILVTTFQFNAACSTDDLTPSSSLQVRWDFENDGVWDTSYTTTKTASQSYDSLGTKTIRLEVRDGHGLTSQTTRQVTVHLVCAGGTCVL